MRAPPTPPLPMLILGGLQSACSVPPTVFSLNPTSLEKHTHFTGEKPEQRGTVALHGHARGST